MQSTPHILVIDDDSEIRTLLGKYLDSRGMRVTTAGSRREMEERLASNNIDLIVLDVMLPDASGFDICRDFAKRQPHVPIILLTALREDIDRIIGLEFGADDYLGKPFNPRELAARIQAVLRRNAEAPAEASSPIYRFAGLTAEPERRRVTASDGSDLALTGAEFNLLYAFLTRPGRLLSREQLLDLTHGRDADPFDRSIDVLMSRLRRKLGDNIDRNIFKTIRNGGYQLVARVEAVDPAI